MEHLGAVMGVAMGYWGWLWGIRTSYGAAMGYSG